MFTAYKTRMEAEGKKVRTGGGFSGTGIENYLITNWLFAPRGLSLGGNT